MPYMMPCRHAKKQALIDTTHATMMLLLIIQKTNKMNYKIVTLICFALFYNACSTSKKSPKLINAESIAIVFGVVDSIVDERDGNTIKIKTNNGEDYYAMVNLPNLGMNAYKPIQEGKKVALKGEIWELQGKKKITVREIVSNDNEAFMISGVVQGIENGTDGYEATIIDISGNEFKAVISIPNMEPNQAFKTYEVGDEATVKGKLWQLGNECRITVRKIID